MSRLSAIVSEAVDQRLRRGRATASDIALYVENAYPDALSDEAEALLRQALRRKIKDELRQRSDDDESGQETLPGLGLPSAIYVRTDGEEYYVRSDAATWDELVAGRGVRVDNIRHAERRLTQYDDTLDRLRPWMAGTDLTVADALLRMQGAA